MYFVKKNISDFFKNHKDMFFIFFILQIISVFFIFFIYGLLVNYQKELDNMTLDTFEFTAVLIVIMKLMNSCRLLKELMKF